MRQALKPSALISSTSRAQRLGAGRGEVRLRPEPLLEHRAHEIGPVVEQEAALADAGAAEAEIARHRIDQLAAIGEQRCRNIDDVGRLGRPVEVAAPLPVLGARDGDAGLDRVAGDQHMLHRQHFVALAQADRQPALVGAVEPGLDLHRVEREVGREMEAGDVGGGDRLEPDRLPDAGGAIVPDGVRGRLPVLLAARHAAIERPILGPDDDEPARPRPAPW